LEWVWLDNFSDNSTPLSTSEIKLTEQGFQRNSTRIETKNTSYRIPLVYSKGYLIYRVRPISRFLDETSKKYYGDWTSGFNEKNTVANWGTSILKITQNHEQGSKNWQFQSSYAEEGKRKDIVSYHDGRLYNRQTVTKINSNNQVVFGETIADAQGRPAIEILPVPLNESAIRYYDGLNKNASGEVFTHKDFDWETPTEDVTCVTDLTPMSTESGASNYYSNAITPTGTYQDLVPNAEGYPYFQTEYKSDNTGRISRKGGVGVKHQLGSGHEMKYFYIQAKQEELNRLFGYKVGLNNFYKKNIVVDPNGQVSINFIAPNGNTIATALVGKNPDNLLGLDAESMPLAQMTSDLLSNNDLYPTGNYGIVLDGIKMGTQIGVVEDDPEITFNYTLDQLPGFYTVECATGSPLKYPFVYDLYISLLDDCGEERLVGGAISETITGIGGEIHHTITRDADGALKVGSYNLQKDLRINQAALEGYADAYITELSDPDSDCYIDPSRFNPNASLEDCTATCYSCEESLICGYLSIADCDTFKAQLAADEEREILVVEAEKEYVLQNIMAATNNTTFHYQLEVLTATDLQGITLDEIALYKNRFLTEFRGLLEGCRDLCKPFVSACDVNRSLLLVDVSPYGQYGGITSAADDAVAGDIDLHPLSVFNDHNKLWYAGTTEEEVVNDDGSTEIMTISNATWRNPDPAVGYVDEFGTPSFVEVEKIGYDIFSPEVAEGVNTASLVESTTNPGFYVIKPEQLKTVEDFLDIWNPTWADALLWHHPEYEYYVYSIALCEGMHTIPGGDIELNTESFDANLLKIETFEEISIAANNDIGITFQSLLNPNTSPDPFLNVTYSTVENLIAGDDQASHRKAILAEALTTNYDGLRYTYDGADYKMNLLQLAYYTVVYSNGLLPLDNAFHTDMQSLQNPADVVATLASIPGLAESQKIRIWTTFRSYYMALKTKLKYAYSNIYAISKNRAHGCIGNIENIDSFATMFLDYNEVVTSGQNNMQNFYGDYEDGVALGVGIADYEADLTNTAGDPVPAYGACSPETIAFFEGKTKRFTPADYGFDSGATDAQMGADAVADANAAAFLATGKCPLAFDIEFLLDGMIDPELSQFGLVTSTLPASSMPYLTLDLYEELGGTLPITTATNITSSGIGSGAILKLKIGNGNDIELEIKDADVNNPCATGLNPITWANYNTDYKITDLKNMYYVPGSLNTNVVPNTYNFEIVASIVRIPVVTGCEIPEEIIIVGTTTARIGECGFTTDALGEQLSDEAATDASPDGCYKRTRFEKGLTRLMNNLKDAGNLLASNISLNNTPDVYGYSSSILPEVLEDSGLMAQWSASQFTFQTAISISFPGVSSPVNINIVPALPNLATINRFTNIQISEDDDTSITITYCF